MEAAKGEDAREVDELRPPRQRLAVSGGDVPGHAVPAQPDLWSQISTFVVAKVCSQEGVQEWRLWLVDR